MGGLSLPAWCMAVLWRYGHNNMPLRRGLCSSDKLQGGRLLGKDAHSILAFHMVGCISRMAVTAHLQASVLLSMQMQSNSTSEQVLGAVLVAGLAACMPATLHGWQIACSQG